MVEAVSKWLRLPMRSQNTPAQRSPVLTPVLESRRIGLICGWLALCLAATPIMAGGDIHFYNRNSKGQFNEIYLLLGSGKPGCHNFPFQRKINRVAQTGYAYCELYTEKDCAADSRLIATWTGRARRDKSKQRPTSRLTQGSQWYLAADENIAVKSWRCAATDKPGVGS